MQRPPKFSSSLAVVCDSAPDLLKPGWKELYDYGIETGALGLRYSQTKDPALGRELLQRCYFEAEKWLQMDPPEYAGAAKQFINAEGHLFTLGHDGDTVQAAEKNTDHFVGLSAASWRAQLREACEINREARSFLPCCAGCGKYQPGNGVMCTGCNVAEYCTLACKERHWEEIHKTRCTKHRACEACSNMPVKHLKCGRCKVATYCNKAHQAWHWSRGHKKECKKV
jgi:hypothetical protein